MKFIDHWLNQFASFLVYRQRAVLWVLALVTLACLPVAVNTLRHIDANLLNQVSDKLPRFKALKEVTTDFGGDTLVCVVSVAESAADAQARERELKTFGNLLAAEFARVGTSSDDHESLLALSRNLSADNAPSPWLLQVECQMGLSLRNEFAQLAREHPQLVFGPDEISELDKRFAPAALANRMREVREELSIFDVNSLERARLLRDPLNVAGLAQQQIKKRLHAQGQNLGNDPDGYLLSKDKTTLLVVGRPTRSSNNVAFNRLLMEACQRAENRAIQKYRLSSISILSTALKDKSYGQIAAGEVLSPAITVGYTGLHAMSVENERSLRRDIGEGTVLAFLALIVIFMIAYRSVQLTFHISFTLLVAAVLTVAIAGLLRGHIGVLGAGFTSILIGTGVDYGIMIYGTFRKLLKEKNLSASAAISATILQRGLGVTIACITSVFGFWGLTVVDFQAIAEFGLLTGVGLLCSAVLMFILFPLLLLRNSKISETTSVPASLGLPLLSRILSVPSGRAGGLVLGAFFCGTAIIAIIFQPELAPGMERFLAVPFDPDIGNLRNREAPASVLRDRVVEKFGRAFADLRVIVESADESTAFRGSAEVNRRASQFVQSGDIRLAGSLVDFAPGLIDQDASVIRLKQLNLPEKRNAFLKAAQNEFGSKADKAFELFADDLNKLDLAIQNAKPVSLKAILDGPLGATLAPYVRIDTSSASSRVRLVNYFFPKDLQYTEDWLRGVAKAVEDPAPEKCAVRLAAARFVGFELKRSVIQDMEWIFALVAIVVAVVVLYPLRSIKLAILSIIPLGFSFLFVVGGIAISSRCGWNLSLNYISLMIFPILLGSAVDYGIYMALDLSSAKFKSTQDVLQETGHSLLLCCATTLGGYGSMIIGSNSGMISFGWTALLGYTGAIFAALVILPALYGPPQEQPVALTSETRNITENVPAGIE